MERAWAELDRLRKRVHDLAETIGEQGVDLTLQDRRIVELERFRTNYEPKVDAMVEAETIAENVAAALRAHGSRQWSAWERRLAALGGVVLLGGFVLSVLHAAGLTP